MKLLNKKFANNEIVTIKHNGYYYQGKVVGQKGMSRIIALKYFGETIIVKRNILEYILIMALYRTI